MTAYPEHPNWQTHRFYAMGSHMALWLELDDRKIAHAALQQVEALFAAAERRMTRFAKTSELSRLNAQPEQWVKLSNILWQVVVRAVAFARETEGLFDPTLLNALEAAGYDRSFNQLEAESSAPRIGKKHLGRWEEIQLDAQRRAIWLPAGVRLDVGGIAKGFSAQQAVAFLSQWGACLVDAGGDLTAGDAPAGWPGWPVGISAPRHEDKKEPEHLVQLWLNNASLATSGIDYRRWKRNGRLAHHLIDPRTGEPAETDILTVSILSSDASHAEAWATAALVAGLEKGEKLLQEKQLAGAFIDPEHHLLLTPTIEPFVAL